jgi:F-type H+-transporting ATPase subunit gamma
MKMIATTRLTKAQKAMREAKGYGTANSVVFEEAKASEAESKPSKVLWVAVSSDRGLCGGIHSSISKRVRRELNEGEGTQVEENSLVILGDKPKAQLSRSVADKIVLSFNQVSIQSG